MAPAARAPYEHEMRVVEDEMRALPPPSDDRTLERLLLLTRGEDVLDGLTAVDRARLGHATKFAPPVAPYVSAAEREYRTTSTAVDRASGVKELMDLYNLEHSYMEPDPAVLDRLREDMGIAGDAARAAQDAAFSVRQRKIGLDDGHMEVRLPGDSYGYMTAHLDAPQAFSFPATAFKGEGRRCRVCRRRKR